MKQGAYLYQFFDIEFHNSFFGMESVWVDGKLVSKKWSFIGASHKFKVHPESQSLEIISKYTPIKGMLTLQLYENGNLIRHEIKHFLKRLKFFLFAQILFILYRLILIL